MSEASEKIQKRAEELIELFGTATVVTVGGVKLCDFGELQALLAERTEMEAAMQAMLGRCPMCQGRGTYETRESMATPCFFCAPLRAIVKRKPLPPPPEPV